MAETKKQTKKQKTKTTIEIQRHTSKTQHNYSNTATQYKKSTANAMKGQTDKQTNRQKDKAHQIPPKPKTSSIDRNRKQPFWAAL